MINELRNNLDKFRGEIFDLTTPHHDARLVNTFESNGGVAHDHSIMETERNKRRLQFNTEREHSQKKQSKVMLERRQESLYLSRGDVVQIKCDDRDRAGVSKLKLGGFSETSSPKFHVRASLSVIETATSETVAAP